MPKVTVRVSNLLHSRVLALSQKERKTLSVVARELLEEALTKRLNCGSDPFTLLDLAKLERLFVAIFATEQMVVRSLDPHRSLLPQAGQKAIELTAEMLGTKRS